MSDRKKRMILQRILGAILIGVSVAAILMALHGKTPEDKDATTVLITAPLGIYMIMSKDCILG